MELLTSGTDVARPSLRAGLRRTDRAVALAAAAVLGAGVLTVATQPPPAPQRPRLAAPPPAPTAEETRARLQAATEQARRQAAASLRLTLPLGGPPYDGLPGRTRIPEPVPQPGEFPRVGGVLPSTGPAPSETSARRAVDLVLGRYCHDPSTLRVLVVGLDGGWDEVGTALRSAGGRSSVLQLTWTGTAYRWRGSASGVGCPDPGRVGPETPPY